MHTYWLALRVIFFSPRYISPPHASCLFRYRDEFSINFSIISPPPPLPPCILRPSLFLRTFLVLFLYENRERNSVLFLARVINSVLFRIVVAFFFYYSRATLLLLEAGQLEMSKCFDGEIDSKSDITDLHYSWK